MGTNPTIKLREAAVESPAAASRNSFLIIYYRLSIHHGGLFPHFRNYFLRSQICDLKKGGEV